MSAAAKPTRRVDAPAEPSYELVDLDRYAVLDGGPVGYIEVRETARARCTRHGRGRSAA